MAFSRMNCRENTLVHRSESSHNAFSPLSEFDLVLGTTHDEAHRWRSIWKLPFDTFLQLKLCDDGGEEEEHLGLGERHTQALSSANQVGNQPLVLGELPRVCEKPVWPELSGLVPVLRVVHDVPEEGEDGCAGRHLVLADCGGLHVHVRGADEVDGGDPQHLVDERHCVRKLVLVGQGDAAHISQVGLNLLENFLLHLWVKVDDFLNHLFALLYCRWHRCVQF